jgi:hypothetical protein
LTEDGSIESFIYIPGRAGFRINADGFAEFCNVVARGRIEAEEGFFRGRVEADSGTFRGRIEAGEGFFRGLLETPTLRSSTEVLYANQRNYSSGLSVLTLLQQEASIWGQSTGSLIMDTAVSGTYGSNSLSRIYFHYTYRSIQEGYITLTFSNGNTQTITELQKLSSNLSFRRITEGWSISMRNLPTENPRIPNVLWRDGTTLKISDG